MYIKDLELPDNAIKVAQISGGDIVVDKEYLLQNALQVYYTESTIHYSDVISDLTDFDADLAERMRTKVCGVQVELFGIDSSGVRLYTLRHLYDESAEDALRHVVDFYNELCDEQNSRNEQMWITNMDEPTLKDVQATLRERESIYVCVESVVKNATPERQAVCLLFIVKALHCRMEEAVSLLEKGEHVTRRDILETDLTDEELELLDSV